MTEVRTDPEAREAMEARRAELGKLRKGELARMHHQAQIDNEQPELPCDHWPKDMLVNAVLEDEGHLWHPQAEGSE